MQTNRTPRIGSTILVAGAALLLSIGGCANHRRQQAEEARQQEAALKPLPNAPVMVYVAPLDLGGTLVDPDAGSTSRPAVPSARPPAEANRMAALLRERIISNLHEAHLPAQAIDDFSAPLRNGWLVNGRLFDISPDGRLKPIALGAASTDSSAWVLINLRDLSRHSGRDLIDFNINAKGHSVAGGNSDEPGSRDAANAAGRFVLPAAAEESDVRRVGYQIANQIVALSARQEK